MRNKDQVENIWKPISFGGTSHPDHTLELISTSRLQVTETQLNKYLIFFYYAVLILSIYASFLLAWGFSSGLLVLLGLGQIFLIFELARRVKKIRSVEKSFDKISGYFSLTEGGKTKKIRLDDVVAVQVLSELVYGSPPALPSYELNIVLRNGRRINILDHGQKMTLLEEAKKLSGFLELPLADNSEGKLYPNP